MSDPREFQNRYRRTMGLFATGVTVVLAERDGEVHGMTANAVTSLSMEPTLLIVCPAKGTRMADHLADGSHFTINILSEGQEELSNHFASPPAEGSAPEFELIPWDAAGRAPRLGGCLGSLGCRVQAIHDGGDHWIVVGEVLDLHVGNDAPGPLIFFGGKYKRHGSSG